jgi:hypothetical protein
MVAGLRGKIPRESNRVPIGLPGLRTPTGPCDAVAGAENAVKQLAGAVPEIDGITMPGLRVLLAGSARVYPSFSHHRGLFFTTVLVIRVRADIITISVHGTDLRNRKHAIPDQLNETIPVVDLILFYII